MLSDPPERSFTNKHYHKKRRSIHFKTWWKKKFNWINYPFVATYRGFGNHYFLHIQGHVFRSIYLNSERNKRNIFNNALKMLKRFMVKTMSKARLKLTINGQEHFTTSDESGHFQFNVPNPGLDVGWHTFSVELLLDDDAIDEPIVVREEVLIPHKTEYAYISDIDDTFLISRSSDFFKKLYLLLTKDENTRKPFVGVVEHYQRLQRGVDASLPNPFFYVSSSEWNLYDFIVDFCELNALPKGIFLLRDLKTKINDFLHPEGNDHQHKLKKITKILDTFPQIQFVLLGDNSQQDPDIYYQIAHKYPDQIKAIYIRDIKKKRENKVRSIGEQLKREDIDVILFNNSQVALAHSEERLFAEL